MIIDTHHFPLPSIQKLRKTKTRLRLTFAGEQLLHHPFFMGLERLHFVRLRGDQLVQRTKAAGDLLLFGI